MGLVIARDYNGNAVCFDADTRVVESDVVNAAEAAIGGATGSVATGISGAATLNASSGIITTESVTTAAGATYTFTLTNKLIKVGSLVVPNVTLGTATTGTATITHVTCSAGSVVIKVQNIHASAAFNGTLKIGFLLCQ